MEERLEDLMDYRLFRWAVAILFFGSLAMVLWWEVLSPEARAERETCSADASECPPSSDIPIRERYGM